MRAETYSQPSRTHGQFALAQMGKAGRTGGSFARERPLSKLSSEPGQRSAQVKGFGCRPVVTYPRVLRAGVRKPPRKEPAGAGRTASGLWGFDGAAAWGGGCAGWVIGGGSTTAVASLALRRRSTGDLALWC